MSLWHTINYNGQTLHDLGVFKDDTLNNPNGYPEALVREAVAYADGRKKAKRSAAATKAAVTRSKRCESLVYSIALKIAANEKTGPSGNCCICKKVLSDAPSIERGIGPECWQNVLGAISRF